MNPESTVTDILLSASGMTKRYGAVTVLSGVSLKIRHGEIHALLGANGAGKSTLCKIISGLTAPNRGKMILGGIPFQANNKQSAEQAGIEIVQQELSLIPTLTVAENLFLTRMPQVAGIIRKRELQNRARRALDRFGLQEIATDTIVGTLGVGRQQMIEIAAALDRQCRLLILDEPTAALSAGETERLFDSLRSLREQGIGIIYISHRLDEVATLADRVTVLRDGKYVCTKDTSDLTTDDMVDLMSGTATNSRRDYRSFREDPIVFRADSISGGLVQDVTFSVRRGERFGIAGLVGAGRTELLRLLFGADKVDSGTVQVGEGPATVFQHPREAVRAGLAMVTEDRKQNGLLISQSIRSNTSICSLAKRFSSLGVLRNGHERLIASEMIDNLETKCNSIEQRVETLSGGNQQKVAVSKWLVRDADVYFFDEPTRGIDVSARRRLYQLFESLAEAGKAIVIVSSDLEELLETCDRIGVMSAGRWAGEYERQNFSSDDIMRAAFDGYQRTEAHA